MNLRRLSLVTSIVTGLLLTSMPLRAQFTWNGNGGAGNNITNGANWVGGNPPSAGSNLTFPDTVANFTVLLTANFTAGALSFTGTTPVHYSFAGSASPVFTVNSDITLAANYVVTFNNTLGVNLATGEHVVDVGNFGVLTLNGVVSGPGHLTKIGTGTLTLTAANTFNYFEAVPVFNNSTAIREGTLRLTGGALNQPGGDIFVGTTSGDNGDIQVESGGDLIGAYLGLGQGTSSSGSSTVTGVGSTVSLSYGLGVGNAGSGIFSILNGATVTVTGTHSSIGENSGSNGQVNLFNSGSTWTDASTVKIGAAGSGNLVIASGADASFAGASIADANGSTGSVTVTGTGSTLGTSNALTIGNLGNGTLIINSGGAVTNTTGYIGLGTGSTTSSVSISDVGSLWTNSVGLYVGLQGHGTLNIGLGAHVTSPDTSIGNNVGGVGTVNITDTGSLLSTSGILYVGSAGNGSLNINSGGVANSTTVSIGNNAGGYGSATVSGNGSALNASASILIGNATTGSLQISSQGLGSAANAVIGVLSGVSGDLSLQGAGSTFSTTGNLTVGGTGDGFVEIQNGGTLTVGGQSILANNTGSTGTVLMSDPTATWTSAGDIFPGNGGQGDIFGVVGQINVGGGSGAIRLGHTGGTGRLFIGTDLEVHGAGAIINAASVTTETGAGTLLFSTTSASATPYYFTRNGLAGGTAVVISGPTNVVQETGYTVLTGTNTYTGGTIINGGTLVAGANGALGSNSVFVSGGILKVASGVTLTNTLDYTNGGTLGGSGIIGTPFTAGALVHLAPGNSPGTLTFSSGLTLASGGTLDFEVQSAAGPAGTGYDLLSISGSPLAITATSGSRFTLKVISLNIAGAAGAVSDFNSASPYAWTFASSVATISGFASNKFTIDTSQFANSLGGGTFSVSQSGNNLILNFTPVPEPSTYALMATGLVLAGLGYRRKLRRA